MPARFRGPDASVNGGYLCGLLAGYLSGPVTVTLRKPPPLDTPMTVGSAGEGVHLRHGETLIAEALSTQDSFEVPYTISATEARVAEGRSEYYEKPLYPHCFVCGTERAEGDGLRVFAGQMPGRELWAAPWTPDDNPVRPEIVWAVLDCPSGIAAGSAAQAPRIVLGTMTARVAKVPTKGEECYVIAWPTGRDGRKLTAGSALLSQSGDVLAMARTVWITLP